MYSSPAIGYLIRKQGLKKNRYVIKTKIIIASYITFAGYLLVKYYGANLMNAARIMAHVEPIIYVGLFAIAYSLNASLFKTKGIGDKHAGRR